MTIGLMTNIQRYSLHDGPGIRTTVFLKGCQLRCPWCHNPETISSEPELLFYPEKCINCGHCSETCKTKAHKIDKTGRHVFDSKLCIGCLECTDVCYTGALQAVGKYQSVSEVMQEVVEDIPFYKNSNGGITVSGGEPLLQIEFIAEILQTCKKLSIHTAIETNLLFPWDIVLKVIPYIDLWMVDVKHFDPKTHKILTGMSNSLLIENLRRLDDLQKSLIVRTPLIRNLTDNHENIHQIAEFLGTLTSVEYYELLSYHPLGLDKLRAMPNAKTNKVFSAPEASKIVSLIASAGLAGIPVFLDGKRVE